MREEYDQIQRKMKEEMKRPTPFERFRKFFSKGKAKRKVFKQSRGAPSPRQTNEKLVNLRKSRYERNILERP